MTTTNVTVTAQMDNAFNAVSRAWDDLFLPVPPEDFGNDKSTWDYVNKLIETAREFAVETNKQTTVAQDLARANVRQTELVQKLRAQVADLKFKLMRAELRP